MRLFALALAFAAVSLAETTALDLSVHDAKRHRDIPVKIFLPESAAPAAVVLFSHGLGGSRHMNTFMGEHWSQAGFLVLFVQHPGSDDAIWRDLPPGRRVKALRDAASIENFRLRAEDIPAVLDQLDRWNRDRDHALYRRADMAHIGMSGHSFGALTTQAVSGEKFLLRARFTDSRIKAAIAFSPSAPRRGDAKRAFGSVKVPWLLMTGTKDVAPIGDADLSSRLAVFPALPPGNKYELVLYNAEHSAFTDRALPGDSETRNPNHHRAILAISTAFWKATLLGDKEAHDWLSHDGVRSVLEPRDRWQSK